MVALLNPEILTPAGLKPEDEHKEPVSCKKTCFQVYDKYLSSKDDTEAPIYNMILDLEAIDLKKLANIITEKKGIVIDLSTYCVSAIFPDMCSTF